MSSCLACGAPSPAPFYTQSAVPAHSCLLLPDRAAALAFPRGDIELVFCPECGFIANQRFDPALNRYSDAYEETQVYSGRFRQFLAALCAQQVERFALRPGMTALEIGCGKGEFLVGVCERAGCFGIGLDPGYRPERTESSAARRIEFIRDLYGPKYGHLTADYIACRHTLEHIAPVREFLGLLRQAIGGRQDLPVFFELPETERVLAEGAFWDVYYEHCSYFTAGSLARLFRASRFDVREVYTAYEGQYLMLEALSSAAPTEARLAAEDDLERIADLVADFAPRVEARIGELARALGRWRASGARVAFWGSGSKCVALLSALSPGEELCAIVDVNPHKHGRFLAGSGREILSPQALATLRPDVVLVMNPIYLEEIGTALRAMSLDCELQAL